MSNLQLFVSSNHHSKPIQRLFSLKPTMDFSIGSHDQEQEEVDMVEPEPEPEERLHSPSSSSSTTTSSSSSSSSSCTEVVVASSNNNIKGLDEDEDEAKEAAAFDNVNVFVVVNDNDDDGGYHTPTSPRHRIPTAIECPRAPKKPLLRLHKKRNREEARRRVDFVEVEDVELIFCADRRRAAKKPKEDAAVTYK